MREHLRASLLRGGGRSFVIDNLGDLSYCTSDPGFCRHAIALGLTYIEEPQSFYDVRTLTTHWSDIPIANSLSSSCKWALVYLKR